MNKRWTKGLKPTNKHKIIVTNAMSAVHHYTITLHSEVYLKYNVKLIFLVYTVLFLEAI